MNNNDPIDNDQTETIVNLLKNEKNDNYIKYVNEVLKNKMLKTRADKWISKINDIRYK